MSTSGSVHGADVVIIGSGLVGLATAAALGERGANVTLLDDRRKGMASTAAAGMLAPAMERASAGSAAHAFALAARDLYPSYLDALAEVTGIRVPLNRDGVLELVVDEADADSRRGEIERSRGGGAEWLDGSRLRSLEPELAPVAGAVLYPRDGAVDNVVLVRALAALVAESPSVKVVTECARALELRADRVAVTLGSGLRYESSTLVLAAGAWTPLLDGLPRPIPVEPVRGQAIALSSAPIRHVTYGPHGYIVPRDGSRSVVGATMEHVGFDTGVTAETAPRLAAAAREIAPAFAHARTLDHWSGLRPVTPDLLPIIGRDPEHPALIYACGHSRNGILLAPLTGECVADLAVGSPPPLDISPFSVTRFASQE
ncbi:MAG TPA: glycine oxidase ThiO [Gemmatimonadaceae bacterium]|nr:glycine oxidase ThiO [Gemmatimonadaceae bacterium]